jgi:hypothetical protein
MKGRVLDRDKFLNITIEIFYELYVFLFEFESSETMSKCQTLTHLDLGTITVVPQTIESQQSQGRDLSWSPWKKLDQ